MNKFIDHTIFLLETYIKVSYDLSPQHRRCSKVFFFLLIKMVLTALIFLACQESASDCLQHQQGPLTFLVKEVEDLKFQKNIC